jgi:dimethylamine/trimethylamine dehydrogenase
MPRDGRFDILFEPLAIGPKVMRNRFYSPPHCTGFGVDKPGSQAAIRRMKAEGGWAVVNTESCSIHPSSDVLPLGEARLWNEGDIRNLSRMCESAHEYGALAGVELAYMGVHSINTDRRLPARGVSQISSEWSAGGLMVAEMDKREIRELQHWYIEAAQRAQSAGFDLINVYGGQGFSITYQFLSRDFNRRSDEYGGSASNRARFWLETLELVRTAVGDSCAIVVRLCLEGVPADLSGNVDEEILTFVESADALVDLWDLQIGRVPEGGWDIGPSRFFAENYQRPWAEKIRPVTRKPLVGVGRFTDPDTMVAVIKTGQLDVIGAARPSIADPFLPKKIEEGRLEDIRECIGCNICNAKASDWPLTAGHIACTQNPTLGEEYRRGWHPESFSRALNAEKNVLVVGAGPAGLECAMVLGKRGMLGVHLVEAAAEIGGSVRWISELPGLAEWSRVVSYRRTQLEKLRNVDIICHSRLSASEIAAYGADLVVIATGSHWATDGLSGPGGGSIVGADANLPYCLTPEQIMVEKKEVPGTEVVVVDYDGYFMGVSIAEKLALEGKRVTIVTHLGQVAWYMHFTLEASFMYRRLHSLGVQFVTDTIVTSIAAGNVTTRLSYGRPGETLDRPADAVVLVTQRCSNDGVYRTLRALGDEELQANGVAALYRVGDCEAPGLIADAVFAGHRLAREIDSANPSEPLPHIREYRVLGWRDSDYDDVLGRARAQ